MSDANVMGRVDYARQLQMNGELQHGRMSLICSNHVIVGCGGVGFWLGLMLAMNGAEGTLILIDGDKLEATNLNRIPCPPSWLGINKTIALRKTIKRLRPGLQIICFPSHLNDDTLALLNRAISQYRPMIWDCTDDARIQTKVHKLARETSLPFRKIGYEGFKVGTYANFDVWFDAETYRPGYRTTMANAMSSAVAACLGVFAEGLGNEADVNVNLQDLVYYGTKEDESDDTDDTDEDEDDEEDQL